MNFCGLFDWHDDLSTLTKIMDDNDSPVSPFIAYQDGYRWPDLFTEIDECLEASILVYELAEIRKMARNNELDEESAKIILSLPLLCTAIMQVIEKYKDSKKLSRAFYKNLLVAAKEREMVSPQLRLTPSSVIAFEDTYAKEELIYAIELSHVRQRITVCFRGSHTRMDWATNYEIYMKEVSNPLASHATQAPTIRVHHGFYNYLFGPNSRGVKATSGENLLEYQEILHEHLLPVVRQFPGYKLYVTGHSLGGALATLFAFQCAACPDSVMPKPVTLYTFGCPYVGDDSFRAAHRVLESQGKLRHMRVSNHKDVVTLVPKMSFSWWPFSNHTGALFKHVGMNLRLYEGDTPFEISFPQVHTGFWTSTYDELARGYEQTVLANWMWNPIEYYTWPHHSLREYNKRALANRPSLQSIQLNDLYSRIDIVGSLIAQF